MKVGWEIKKLGEVCSVAAGQGAPQGDANYCLDGIPFIKAGNLEDLVNGLPELEVQKVSDEVAKQHRLKIYKAGSVVFAKSGMSCMKGHVYSLRADCYVVSHLAILTPHGISTAFLKYILTFHRPNTLVKDSAYPSISLEDIKAFPIPVPSRNEQEKIVAELDCLSGIIEKKKQQLKELDTLAQSIFYEMFGDPIDNNKGWEVKKLGELVKVRGGYAFKSNLFTDDGVPILRIGNINTGRLRTSQLVFYKEDKTLSKYIVYPNDLVISLTGTAGKDDYGNVCVLDNTYSKYYLNQRNAKIELSSHIRTTYLQYFLKDRRVKCTLTGLNRGVRQGNISNKDIEELVIPVVPISLQQEFASKIEALEKQKELIKQSIQETETLFNSRMDYYFN